MTEDELTRLYQQYLVAIADTQHSPPASYAEARVKMAKLLNSCNQQQAESIGAGKKYRQAAHDYAGQAYAALSETGENTIKARASFQLGMASWFINGPLAAGRHFERAVHYFSAAMGTQCSDIDREFGVALLNLALTEQEFAQHERAIEILYKARQYLDPQLDEESLYTLSMVLANTLHDEGRHNQMREVLAEAEALSRKSADRRLRWLNASTLLCLSSGHYASMQTIFAELYEIFDDMPQVDASRAAALTRSARILSNIGEPDQASSFMAIAESIDQTNAPKSFSTGIEFTRASIAFNQQDFEQSLQILQRLRTRCEIEDDDFDLASISVMQARCHMEQADITRAIDALQLPQLLPDDNPDWQLLPHRVPVLLELGSIELSKPVSTAVRERPSIFSILQSLLMHPGAWRETNYVVDCYELLARYLSAKGCTLESVAWLKLAVRAILQRRVFIPADQAAANTELQRHLDSIELLSDLLLRRGRFLEDDALYQLRSHLLSCLKGNDVQSDGIERQLPLTACELATIRRYRHQALNPVQPDQNLRAVVNEILRPALSQASTRQSFQYRPTAQKIAHIQLQLTSRGVVCRTRFDDETRTTRTDTPIVDIIRRVRDMRQSLLLGWGDWREHGTVLFRLLVQQALEDLPITTRLALNCCNTLSWVPYCALNYKRRFLIEDYEIVFSSFTPNPIDKVITTGRAAALPSKNLTSVQTLPGVAREIDIVSTYRHHRRQTTVETNNLSELLKYRPSVLHLAGHFEIPVDSGPPRLDLGPAGSLSLKQLLSMEWDCDLVYLSACNTGVRAIADKALKAPVKYSLADCVIERGAHSAIGTLWDIPDNNTTDFVAQFYRTLQSCSDPVTALAVTQRDMIATTDGNRGDWAAYRQFQ